MSAAALPPKKKRKLVVISSDESESEGSEKPAQSSEDDDAYPVDFEPATPTAKFLARLFVKPASKSARGSPCKAGVLQIREKSDLILSKAVSKTNDIAEVLGLGPCQIAPVTDRNRTNNRPCERLSAMFPPRKNRVSRWALSYHITWVAMFGLPPAEPRLGYSHRCHEPCCVNARHGLWENIRGNNSRNRCKDGRSHMLLDNGEQGQYLITNCPHDPPCLSGTTVRGMEHPSIIRLG